MAHILDGDWRSLIIRNGSPVDDKVFHIEVTSNVLEPKSTHNGVEITGVVGKGTVFDHLIINRTDVRVRYKGILLVNGPTMLICGLQNLNPQVLFDLEREGKLSEKELIRFFDQEQEIWIATKP